MTSRKLADFFTVKSRFQRSIQLSKDWDGQNGILEYLLSPTAEEITRQIVFGLKKKDGLKAWSITGPYGTGKSAFALFLTDLFANKSPKHEDAKAIRKEYKFGYKPFIPILLVGQRVNIIPDLLVAIEKSIRPISANLANKAKRILKNVEADNREIVSLFEEASELAKREGFGGLLVIIDEFGKYLEYAADNPDRIDILFMQDLAEMASRSNTPILLITILHSAFADYLTNVDEARRAEWQKVQGRYADLSFLEPPEQFLKLIGAALNNTLPVRIQNIYDGAIEAALDKSAFNEARNRLPLEQLLPKCIPLDPVVSLILWPLFRSTLSQNERSLFSFLNDYSPYGFQEFLQNEMGQNESPSYKLNNLYDYISFALGDSLFMGSYSRRWAGINSALDRISSNAPGLAREVVKVIGLLGFFEKEP